MKGIRLISVGLILFLFVQKGWTQQDSCRVQRLDEVEIGGGYYKTERSTAAIQTLTAKQIENLPTLQLSDALKYMSGVVVKDYGGTGGMKTISVRGLGAQHTGVAYDGIALTDCQTGQIDLGRISLDNVQNIRLTTGLDEAIFQPARLFSYSNLLNIRTLPSMPSKAITAKVAFTAGSYQLLAPQLFFEHYIKSRKKDDRYLIWNLSAGLTSSKGDYPYLLHYGGAQDSVSHERRQNSDILAFTTEANLTVGIDNHQFLSTKGYYYDSDRGLPSATVFYNLNASQRLSNRNGFGQIRYTNYFTPRWYYSVGAKFNYDYTHYIDPDYLNDIGYLDNEYQQYEGYLTQTLGYKILELKNEKKVNLSAALSNDIIYNQLQANTMEYVDPERYTTLTSLSVKCDNKQFVLVGNMLLTTVNNRSQGERLGKDYLHLSPAVSASTLLGKAVTLRAFYKNIFRMPTFNDLYYREVGNLDLEPEKTHQWDLGAVLEPQRFAAGKMIVSASLDGYFNIVKDKIVAFPSHNLFSWTMLNYGKVWVAGAELNANYEYQFVKRYFLRLNGNVTYQKAVDRTDATGKTFNHQIPYTPVWSGSASASLQLPWITLSYALIVCGDRYALGQNIPANLVEGYVDHSVTIGHLYDVKKCKLGFKGELLNLANRHYEIIRNYPMQGFSWRLKVWVEF